MLIHNGTIIDGTGRERFKGSVRIENGKIKQVGNLTSRNGERVIDAKNQFITPGFVDILNRSDIHLSIFQADSLRSFIKQGVTTILGGGCGSSLAPLAGPDAINSIQKWQDVSMLNVNWSFMGEFLDEVERYGLSLNFATLTGHATLRRGVVGNSFEKLREGEIKRMEYLAERSFEEGSFGISTGLAYSHAKVAGREELNRMADVVRRKEGLYATHLRDEGRDLTVSVNETIAITRANKLSSHIFHFKALGKSAWPEFSKALGMIESARAQGEVISFDVYPYTKTASVLYLFLPDWAVRGGKKEVLKNLRDSNLRKKIRQEMLEKEEFLRDIVVAISDLDNTFIGKTILEIAKNQEISFTDAFLNIILASQDRVRGFIPTLNEDNTLRALKSEASFVASDGAGYRTTDRKKGVLAHPRSFGAFPRFLARYVRDAAVMDWESSIAKITSRPAEKIGLKKRGIIKNGYFADIVVFDPKTIGDRATFKDPFQYSQGVNYVFVNGELALNDGKFQKKNNGRVLRK